MGFSLRVRLFAVLRERTGCDQVLLENVPDGASLADVKRLVAEALPDVGDLGSIAGVLGTSYAPDSTPVGPGDDVALLPPVSGGDHSDGLEEGLFELSADPIDVAALHGRVAHDSCGAVVLFTGMTRDTNRGQSVVRLDYEAFDEMAGPEMRRIFSDCVNAPGEGGAPDDGIDRSLRMLCVHRTGTVGVGEPSVVVAVASPHRDAAFRAARFLIDTLKERLPVWKKEVYGDGHHWIGDRS